LPTAEELQREVVQLKAENARLGVLTTTDSANRTIASARCYLVPVLWYKGLVQRDAQLGEHTGTLQHNAALAEEVAALERELRAASGQGREEEVGGVSPEYEELQAKFELLEQMFQPV
jgi:hypothetical protein